MRINLRRVSEEYWAEDERLSVCQRWFFQKPQSSFNIEINSQLMKQKSEEKQRC